MVIKLFLGQAWPEQISIVEFFPDKLWAGRAIKGRSGGSLKGGEGDYGGRGGKKW